MMVPALDLYRQVTAAGKRHRLTYYQKFQVFLYHLVHP